MVLDRSFYERHPKVNIKTDYGPYILIGYQDIIFTKYDLDPIEWIKEPSKYKYILNYFSDFKIKHVRSELQCAIARSMYNQERSTVANKLLSTISKDIDQLLKEKKLANININGKYYLVRAKLPIKLV